MSYRTPSHRATAVNQVRNALLASRKAVLTTHLNADGDGAGSEAALAAWLRANGTEAWIINPTSFPDSFRFLVEQQDWVVPAGSRRARALFRAVVGQRAPEVVARAEPQRERADERRAQRRAER